MKLFFFSKSLAAGGAETQSTILASGLKARGYEVEYIVYSKTDADAVNLGRIIKAGIPVHEFYWKNPLDLWKMYRLFRANRGGAFFGFTAFPNFIGGIVARAAGVKRVYAGIRSDWLPEKHILMERFLNRYIVAKTVFNSYRARNKFLKLGFSEAKSAVITNAIEQSDKAKDYQVELSAPIVITVGRFTFEKDYKTWVKVFEIVHQHRPDVRGVIIGYGVKEQEIRDDLHEAGLDGIVTIKLGNVGKVDVPMELSQADVFLLTSIMEGCCNTIAEAMRAGLPFVATDVGDCRIMAGADNERGFWVEVGDARSLATKVVELLNNRNLREQMGMSAREFVSREYSAESVFTKYETLIRGWS